MEREGVEGPYMYGREGRGVNVCAAKLSESCLMCCRSCRYDSMAGQERGGKVGACGVLGLRAAATMLGIRPPKAIIDLDVTRAVAIDAGDDSRTETHPIAIALDLLDLEKTVRPGDIHSPP